MATPVEQEREVRELIRRADRTAVPTNHVRKDTLKRLIELAHSLHPPLKKIAANNIARFFKDFPDLDEDAINAIYDLCEDQDPQIRIDGYNAIVQMSREQTKWVKRNADVLVQLLQSDEPEEVAVVKIALSEHLEMDSKVALGVLCDQIVPPDDPMDEEDGAIRERLRSLVVAFMASEARQAIIERHASQAGSEQEKIVINGLFKAVSKFGRTDATRIIKDILIYLPSFSGRSTPRGNELLHIVLEQARSSLKGDLATATTASLNLTGYFLDLAGYLAIEKGVSDPAQLLRFYCTSSILGKMTLQRLSRDAHLFVVVRTAEALRVCSVGKSPDKGDTAAMRRQIVDACAILLPFFVKAKPSDVRVWIACEILLSACQQRKDEESWNASSAFITTLEEIGRLASEQKGLKLDRVQGLIRSLGLPALQPLPPKPPPTLQASDSAPFTRPQFVIKRKAEDEPGPNAGRLQPGPISIRGQHAREQPPHIRQARSQPAPSIPSGLLAPEPGVPSKRVKTSVDMEDTSSRSLLSRMGSGNEMTYSHSNGRPFRRADITQPSETHRRNTVAHIEKERVIGLSIKGAAKAAENGRGRSHSPPPQPSSLLERMQTNGEGWRRKDRKKRP